MPIPIAKLTSPLLPTGLPPALSVSSVQTLATQTGRPPRVTTLSPSTSPRVTPLASPAGPAPSERTASPGASAAASPAPSTGVMMKEEKAAEIVRRKEERKQVHPCLLLGSFAHSYCDCFFLGQAVDDPSRSSSPPSASLVHLSRISTARKRVVQRFLSNKKSWRNCATVLLRICVLAGLFGSSLSLLPLATIASQANRTRQVVLGAKKVISGTLSFLPLAFVDKNDRPNCLYPTLGDL